MLKMVLIAKNKLIYEAHTANAIECKLIDKRLPRQSEKHLRNLRREFLSF